MTYPYTAQSLRDDILELLDAESTGASVGRYSDALLYRRINLAQHRLDALLSRLNWPDWLTHWVCVGVYGKNPAVNNEWITSLPFPPQRSLDGSDPVTNSYWVNRAVDSGWTEPVYSAISGNAQTVAPSVFRILSVRIAEDASIPSYSGKPWVALAASAVQKRTRLLEESTREDMFQDVTPEDWTFDDPPKYRLNGDNAIVFDRYSNAAAGFIVEYTASALEMNGTSRVALQPLWAQYLVADVVANLADRDREFALADRQRSLLAQYEAEIAESSGRRNSAPKRIRDDQTLESGYQMSQQEVRDRLTFGPWWP